MDRHSRAFAKGRIVILLAAIAFCCFLATGCEAKIKADCKIRADISNEITVSVE